MANRKVSVWKYVKVGKQWKYCKLIMGRNHKPKVAEFNRVKPIKTTDSTKPATPEKAKQVQRITQETPKQPKPVEPEIPKAVQQQKLHKPEKPEPIQPVEPELTRPFHQIKPEILPNTRG